MRPEGDGEIRPPLSFTVTRDGQLAVLDSAKDRLVFYGDDGRLARTVSLGGMRAPSEVAVAADGTIIVQDLADEKNGLRMIDPATGQVKPVIPVAPSETTDVGMYTAGNDIFFDAGGTSRKGAQTGNRVNAGSSDVYSDENGVIPGHVAPDARSVLSAGIDSFPDGEFTLNLVRGSRPEHIFSRFYKAAGELYAIPFFQMDGKGDIYVVLEGAAGRQLLCLNAQGDPVGMAALPLHQVSAEETLYRTYSVVESGGLLYHELSDAASTFEWFDCH